MDRWANRVSILTGRVDDLRASLSKAESELEAATEEHEYAKTAPALKAASDPAQMSIDDVAGGDPE